jgi:hypothetical protein
VSQSEECVHPELTAPQRSLKRIPSSKGVGQDGVAEDTLDFATEIEDDSGLNYQYKTPSRESESVTTASTNRPSTISQSISLQSSVAGGGVQEKENFAKMDEGDLMRRYLRDNAQGRTLRSDVIPPPGAVSNSKMSSKLSSSDLGSSGIISLQPLSSDGAATAGMNPIHSENRI